MYCSYLLIPSFILLSLLAAYSDSYSRKERSDSGLIPGKNIEKDIYLFGNAKFNDLDNKLAIITKNKDDCDIIDDLIHKNQSSLLGCVTEESDIPEKVTNVIKIINDNGKYKIELIELGEGGNYYDKELLIPYYNFKYEEYSDPFYNEDLNNFSQSEYTTFLEIQSLFAQFLIQKEKRNKDKEIILNLGQNPYPPHRDSYYPYMGNVVAFSITVCLQFSMTTYFFNMRLIDEKEKKLTILLERQGISKKDYFFSWLLSFILLAIIPLISFILYFITYIYIHPILFLINLLLFIISLFPYAYFLYVCISTSKTGSIVIKFLNFTSAVLGSPISFPQCSKITKVILAFIPQVNIYLCSNAIDKLDAFSKLSWEKLWLKANKFSFMESIIMYLVEILFYSLLSIFIEKYKNSGLSFFLFIRSLFTKVSRNIENQNNENLENNDNIQYERYFQELSSINQQRKTQQDCLSIVNVTKKFDTLKAVDNFNCDLFGNEIFCLLGHNGAGKTTLINMISGIYDPTHGDIFYKGRSLVTNKDYLFDNIGVCQQEDIFFDYLTVSDHLKYMCEIKGGKANIREISELIIKIGLAEKSTALCSTLSGGQKRKLCTALALIGNSTIVLLDEPTSGMDPMSKKSLWDFLKNYQKDKILLITTHSLDEAEYLGDRIGIMSDGHFICCGTSSFLKSKYPCGFNINLLINSKKFDDNKKKIIFEKIKTFEPQALIKIASKSVFSINIQSNNEHVEEIFRYIEESKQEFGIEDYTVASTSLEDVFLKINNKSNLNNMKYITQEDNNNNIINNNEEQIILPDNLVGMTDCCSQLISQLHRNFLPLKRNISVVILEYFAGLGIIYIFVFLFSALIYGMTNQQLNLVGLLEENKIFYYESDSLDNYLKKSYVYDSTSFITLKKLSSKPDGLDDLIKQSYEESFANIAESSILLEKEGNNLIAYASQLNYGYLYANTMFIVSAFLKSEYNIDAAILSKMEFRKTMTIGDDKEMDSDTISVLIYVCIGSVFGYVIYLGGLINEKIKERKTNIKHLLYLSGSNSWSYWLSFFIIDYIKLIIYTILLIIPIYYVSSSGGYYFLLNMVIINASSLIFIYFVSFFGSNADSGVKFLFVLLLGFVIGLIVFLILALFMSLFTIYALRYVYNSFIESYNFTIFDITPVTSMLLSFGRILYGVANFSGTPLYKYGPGTYLATSYMVQIINLIVYGILLILMEAGYLRRLLNTIKIKFCLSEKNFAFSTEEVSDEFLIFNNVNNPALLNNQLTNNIPNQPQNVPMYGTNNNIVNPNNNNQNQLYMNPPINVNNNNQNQMYINAPINANNNQNQNNMNQPIYGTNNSDFMNMPIYGNDLSNLNIPVYENNNDNNNIINTNSKNQLAINDSVNNSVSQPLLDNIITQNNNNNNIKTDAIDNAINDMALPETNVTFNIRKGNPYINQEKDSLAARKDLTTRIEGLQKTFWFCCKKNVRAVNNLYLGLEANEKFGLLGFNGSGKTTTFRAITNEILYDYGKITLFGFDNQKEFEKIRARIGYCPQENPLFEFMKVREILEFYSDLKTCNIPYQIICEKFGLEKYLDTYCINLSGGNKRKLTFAIAIMNKPTLLLLDEPSTGVDPESRRFMWKNINELSFSGHKYNMILTTHSMEEAEILCDRVSWLKKGNFVCIGVPEKLKIQYSLGYKLHVKFNDNEIKQFGDNENNNMQETFQIICGLITGFANYSVYILNNPSLEPYLRALIDVINKIKVNTKKIMLVEIGKDLSFKLIVNIVQEKKCELFSEVLSMKNKNKLISEMIISMESLENILTSF